MRREHTIEQAPIEIQPILHIVGENSISDSSQYHHTITNTNVTISDGSMYYNGSAMLNTDIGDLKITNGVFTLEMWVKLENTAKQYKCIADFCQHDCFYFDASDNRDGTMIIIFTAPNWFPSDGWAHDNSVWLTTSWQHVAIVGDGSSNSIYVNGIKKTGGYFDAFTRQLSMKNGKIRIGNIEYGNLSRYFKGWMKHFKLYNIAKYTDNFTPQL